MKKFFLTISTVSFLALNIVVGQIYIDTGSEELENTNTNVNTTTTVKTTSTNVSTKNIYVPANGTENTKSTTINTTTSNKNRVIQSEPRVFTSNENTSKAYSGNLSAANDELPPFAEAGKCYARCFIPDQYEFYESEVIDRPASYKSQIIPATYETVFDTVVVMAEKTKVEVVPAVYETKYEEIMVSPATTRWEKGTGDANCLSNDPKDCQVICLKEIPAQFNKVERKVVKTPSFTRQIIIPAEIKIVPRQVMVKPAETIQIEVPASYKKIMEKRMTKSGGYTDWREVLCGAKLTSERIRQIQNALISKGYSVGTAGADNVFGEDTKTALKKFQADNNLPQGNLNMETLNALGVK
jgi:hypothetical protein